MLTVVIDINKLNKNIQAIKKIIKGEFCAVVKADAYGHGDKIVSYIEDKVDSFAVSNLLEANKLLNYNIKKPIYILTPCLPKKITPNFIYTIASMGDLSYLLKLKSPYIKYVSIKINSGMNRLGVDADMLDKILKTIYACHNVEIVSVFTHFYNGENCIDTNKQCGFFQNIIDKYLLGSNIKIHCCASLSALNNQQMHFDMVRIGLAMYGYGHKDLLPIMSAYTQVLQVNFVKKGEHIGYGNFLANSDTKTATISVGYADGYRRLFDKPRYVSYKGKFLKVLSVCMDMCIIDATDTNIQQGDIVYILGKGISGENLAESYNSIVYEVLTSFKGNRVKHIYKNNFKVQK